MAWVAVGSAAVTLVGGYLLNKNNASKSADDASGAASQGAQTAADMWNYYKANYQPLESNLINQAETAGSPAEFARARGAANADVTGAFDQARKNSLNRMQSYGINPGSPAYQSTAASTDLAEGATKAGALTAADNNTRNLAYSKALDVVGLGKNIPAQSSASAANAANAATNASRNQFLQNTQTTQNAGYGLSTLGNAAQKWFGSPTPFNPNAQSPSFYSSGNFGGADVGGVGAQPYAEGGNVTQDGMAIDSMTNSQPKFARGSSVTIDAEKKADGSYDATALKGVLQKKGLNPRNAHVQAHSAHRRHKGAITPHMRHFASGGGVGRQGLQGPDASNMGELQGPGTPTSDSIPAVIDGKQPAALSTNEFVMNAEVPKLSGEEILEAINQAGLAKRGQTSAQGMEPQTQNGVPQEQARANGGTITFASGGVLGGEMADDTNMGGAGQTVRANIGGVQQDISLLVPTLTPQEVALIQSGGKPTSEIMAKAVNYANGIAGDPASAGTGPGSADGSAPSTAPAPGDFSGLGPGPAMGIGQAVAAGIASAMSPANNTGETTDASNSEAGGIGNAPTGMTGSNPGANSPTVGPNGPTPGPAVNGVVGNPNATSDADADAATAAGAAAAADAAASGNDGSSGVWAKGGRVKKYAGGDKVEIDSQTRVDNKVADAQGVSRSGLSERPAKSVENVPEGQARRVSTYSTQAEADAAERARRQEPVRRAPRPNYSYADGGGVGLDSMPTPAKKPEKKSDAEWRQIMRDRSQAGGLKRGGRVKRSSYGLGG